MIELFDREDISRSDFFDYCEDVCGRGQCDYWIHWEDFRDEKACDRYGFNGLLFSSEFPNSELNDDR